MRLNVPVNNFFSHVGTEPTLPGFNQYCRKLMCLAQGPNTVPLVGISIRSPTLYHYATSLPSLKLNCAITFKLLKQMTCGTENALLSWTFRQLMQNIYHMNFKDINANGTKFDQFMKFVKLN